MRLICALMLFLAAPSGVAAQQTELTTLQTADDTRGFAAVGRLDIAGQGFCTAALIETNLIVTAAHCLFDPDNQMLSADRFTFQAGLRNGRAEAVRGITRIAAHPSYTPDGPSGDVGTVAMDIAVLELDRPIRQSRLAPYAIADRPSRGDQVSVVSYGEDRSEAPSLQETCEVIQRQAGAIVMTCDVVHGSSGAPVFSLAGGVPRIVSIVSAKAQTDGADVSLGTALNEPLAELLAHLAAQPLPRAGGTQRRVTIGDRSANGAKFIRP